MNIFDEIIELRFIDRWLESRRQRRVSRRWQEGRRRVKERIEKREGRKFAAKLLRKSDLNMSYQYQVTQPRRSWYTDTETAIRSVIGWKDWEKLSYHSKEKLLTAVLELVFKRAGADWNCSAGSLGLGLDATHWVSIGVEARKMVKDQFLLLKLAQ